MSAATIEPRGPFTLASAARFIAGWGPTARPGADGEGAPTGPAPGPAEVRLAFVVDDWSGHAGVVLRQSEPDAPVTATVVEGSTAEDPARAIAQAARVVSLDHDGTGYAELGEREPLIGRLQRESGFLRPVLFHSPYEAACWAVISARLRQPQARRVRDALAAEHGTRLEVGEESLPAFPAPERLLALDAIAGLTAEKVRRLHGVARAALQGELDRDALLAAGHADATARLRALRGIGPFWADGIYLRAAGPADATTVNEPRLRAKAAALYGDPAAEHDDAAFAALTERWRPWRTWAGVLVRAAR